MGADAALAERVPGPAGLPVSDKRKPADREVARDQKQCVSLDEVLVAVRELVRGASARMPRYRRLVATAPTGKAQPKGEVDVYFRARYIVEAVSQARYRIPDLKSGRKPPASRLARVRVRVAERGELARRRYRAAPAQAPNTSPG